MFTRSLALLSLSGLIVGSPPLAARQDPNPTAAWRGIHRDMERPDYLKDLVSLHLPNIDMPPLPTADQPTLASGASPLELEPASGSHTWRGIHRATDRPDYLSGVVPPNVRPIRLPPPPVGEAPAVVRGLYLNAWVFSGKRFYDLVRLADTTEVNAFVIDVKDATGYLTYRSSVPTAIEIGANGFVRASDVRNRLALLQQRGIHPIVRIVVAKDPLLANGKKDWSVQHVDGGLWTDRLGHHWVDAYRDSVWLYAADIAQEAVLMGFAEIQFDYIRFPDEPAELLDKAIFPARLAGQSRRDAVTTNLATLRQPRQSHGGPVHRRRLRAHNLGPNRHGDWTVLGGRIELGRRSASHGVSQPLSQGSVRSALPQCRAVHNRSPCAGGRSGAERQNPQRRTHPPLPPVILHPPGPLWSGRDSCTDGGGLRPRHNRLGAMERERPLSRRHLSLQWHV